MKLHELARQRERSAQPRHAVAIFVYTYEMRYTKEEEQQGFHRPAVPSRSGDSPHPPPCPGGAWAASCPVLLGAAVVL